MHDKTVILALSLRRVAPGSVLGGGVLQRVLLPATDLLATARASPCHGERAAVAVYGGGVGEAPEHGRALPHRGGAHTLRASRAAQGLASPLFFLVFGREGSLILES